MIARTGLCLLAVALASVTAADPKPMGPTVKPQWQRMLTAADAKRADELTGTMNRHLNENRFQEAVKSAEAIVAFRTERQGHDHHQTIDAVHELSGLKTLAGLSDKDRAAWRAALDGLNNSQKLQRDGRPQEAQPGFESMLKWSQKHWGKDHPNTAFNHNRLAINFDNQGRYSDALVEYRTALAINQRQLGERHPMTVTCFSNVAFSLYGDGKSREAEPIFEKVLELTVEISGDDHADTATSCNNLASVYREHGRFADAAPLLRKALDFQERTKNGNVLSLANTYGNLAVVLNEQGRSDEAENFCRKSIAIRETNLPANHPLLADSYGNLSLILLDQRKGEEARAFEAKAMKIRQGNTNRPVDAAYSINAIAADLLRQGKLAEARIQFDKALALRKKLLPAIHPDLAVSQHNLATCLLALGLVEEAKPLLEQSIAIRRTLWGNGHPDLAESYAALAETAAMMGRADESERALATAIEAYEAGRILSASGLERANFAKFNPRLALAAFLHRKDPVAAWRMAELGRARGLLDQSSPQFTRRLTPMESTELDDIRDKMAGLGPAIFDLSKNARRTDAETAKLRELTADRQRFQSRITALAAAASEREIASMEEIQKSIPAETAMLFWIDVRSTIGTTREKLACVVRSTAPPHWERLSGTGPNGIWTSDDDSLPERLRTALVKSAPAAEIASLARQLHHQRIAPAAKHLVGAGTIYVQALNDMAGLPLDLLLPDATIGYVASGTQLARLRGAAPVRTTRLLAVGDPVYAGNRPPSRDAWKDLPGTRVETNHLQRLFGMKAQVLTDSQASEQALDGLRKSGELANYRYIHFATHGEGNSVRAFESSLILAQDQLPRSALPRSGEPYIDGQLTAREVLDHWKLDAELVTLSACETAIGKAGGGDGPLGFAQAFQTAGARAVCLSLWKVDDAATSLVMGRFYENLLGQRDGLAKPLSKAAALDEAKRWLRNLAAHDAKVRLAALGKDVTRGDRGKGVDLNATVPAAPDVKPFAHPKYWAAFILYGDPN